MKKRILAISACIALTGTQLYAGNGDLIVDGKIGVGTASPNAPIDVKAGEYRILLEGRNTWTQGINLPVIRGSYVDEWIMLHFPHIPYLQNGIGGFNGTTLGSRLRLAGDSNASSYWDIGVPSNVGTDKFAINRNDNALLVVDNMGSLGIGTINPLAKLHVGGDNYALFGPNSNWGAFLTVGGNGHTTNNASVVATNGNLHLDAAAGAFGTYINYYAGTGGILFGNGASGVVGSLSATGNLWIAGGLTQYSDLSLKKDIEVIPEPIGKLKLLHGVYYKWKDPKQDQARRIGVIAQEVEKVLPEVVKEGPDGTKAVAYTEIIPVLIEAIKEQQRQIEVLKMEISTLRGR